MDTTSTTARLKEFGTWTEQTSSSGKRYYYNSSTNISQWEKPTEWKHAEKLKATASLKNGNSNGGHNSAMQQMPKITKSAVENEKVSSSLPTIRMPQHQQPQPHKHSTQTGSSSTPTSTPPNFRPGTLSNLQQPFKAMTEKLNSQLATTMTSADKIPQNLCKVEATKTISSSSCFPASTSTTTLSARTIPTTSSSTLQTANATPSSSYQQVKRPPEKSPSSIHDSFCEEKYQKLWRPDLSGSRRALGVDSFAFDMRKSADRQTKQMAAFCIGQGYPFDTNT